MSDENYTFTQARTRLEEIVTQVRSKDVSLEKSLDLLEEGVRLANICTEQSDHTEWRSVVGDEGEAEGPDATSAAEPEGAADEEASSQAAEADAASEGDADAEVSDADTVAETAEGEDDTEESEEDIEPEEDDSAPGDEA